MSLNSTKLTGIVIVYAFVGFVMKSFLLFQNYETSLVLSILGAFLKFHNGISFSFFICRFAPKINTIFFNRKVFIVAEKLFHISFLSSLVVAKCFLSNTKTPHEISFLNIVSSLIFWKGNRSVTILFFDFSWNLKLFYLPYKIDRKLPNDYYIQEKSSKSSHFDVNSAWP